MPVDNFNFFGGFSKQQSVDFNGEDLVNLFMINDAGGKKQKAFIAIPGVNFERDMEGGYGRALTVFKDSMYGVSGGSVVKINSALVSSPIGTIGTNTGFVSTSDNNSGQVSFVDGQAGYVYDTNSGVFAPIMSPGFPSQPTNIAFLDGFSIVPSGGDDPYFGISDLNNTLNWDALNYARVQTYSGSIVGVGVVNERVFLMKTFSTEVWYNAGQSDFPLRKDQNLLFNYGCLTAASIKSDFGYLFWLARDKDGVGSVMMTTGGEPSPISNEAVEDLIATFTAPTDMDAYIYKDGQHIFYVMSWTTDDYTLVYDVNSKIWHRMEMIPSLFDPNVAFSGKRRHISSCHAYFNGNHFVGSYKSSNLYDFSRRYFSNILTGDDAVGEPIVRNRRCSHFFSPNYRRVQVSSIQVDARMGLGFESGLDVYEDPNDDPTMNPQMFLRISRDGGHLFGNSRPAPLGKIGQRKSRAIFRRLGIQRDLVADFSIYAPVGPIALLGAAIDYKVLRS